MVEAHTKDADQIFEAMLDRYVYDPFAQEAIRQRIADKEDLVKISDAIAAEAMNAHSDVLFELQAAKRTRLGWAIAAIVFLGLLVYQMSRAV